MKENKLLKITQYLKFKIHNLKLFFHDNNNG